MYKGYKLERTQMLHNKRMDKSFMEYPYHEMLTAIRVYFFSKRSISPRKCGCENALFSFMLLLLPILLSIVEKY